jgi:methionyl aminopeptidase
LGREPVIILSAREVEKMRTAGQLAARMVHRVGRLVRPGVSTLELDEEAVRLATEAGAVSAPLGYKGFPRSICTSVNEVVCHGIPSADVKLREGDIISVDVTPRLQGYHGDTCWTFAVGEVGPRAQRLMEVTLECLELGIRSVRPGGFVGDIGKAIADHAEAQGFSVVRDFVGHGVGSAFHSAPQIPHFRPTKRGMRLRPGMAFTIEPMINEGVWQVEVLADGWTAVTRDRMLSAQYEHTVLVTTEGVEVLTRLEEAA